MFLIGALRTVRQRYPFSLYAYVLMSNHFHLLLEVHRFPTARILQSLLTGYARRFNKIHNRRGHLFEGRYKAIMSDRDIYLLELVRYIPLNPVRAKVVKRPGDWQWSGHREIPRNGKIGLIDSGPVMGELRTAALYEAFVRGWSESELPGGVASRSRREFFNLGGSRDAFEAGWTSLIPQTSSLRDFRGAQNQ